MDLNIYISSLIKPSTFGQEPGGLAHTIMDKGYTKTSILSLYIIFPST